MVIEKDSQYYLFKLAAQTQNHDFLSIICHAGDMFFGAEVSNTVYHQICQKGLSLYCFPYYKHGFTLTHKLELKIPI